MEAERTTHDHSLTSLIRDLREETTTLVRQEIALAKAELGEKFVKLTRNVLYIGIGAILAVATLLLLLLALRDLVFLGLVKGGMVPEIAIWAATLIVAGVVGITAWVMIAKGKKTISEEGLSPDKTIETLREDKQWLKQKLQRT